MLYAVLARCLILVLVSTFFISPELFCGGERSSFYGLCPGTLRQQLDYLKDLRLKSCRVNFCQSNDAERAVVFGRAKNIGRAALNGLQACADSNDIG
jgi:hypothetical protein